ncbi:ferric-dicitrate binding protein FerR, regulates iron transport through sigma-19 [Chitinophaga eiseniae]|uniref:Ferric-dicitrate binding protein FerR, regulates iron transport through sigma-19 n=1 Tax=Chitinophaga eiseniae TaxID=634771 RepID=A0A1T4KAP6_9BACT|nr:FecR family protein [Chitinophaga eiseniae]SJZ39456.1 ferric-dicitrate binding protein FerR, regulates iron transport through sigma-19 [Chitinophaga eiseniae]
MDHPQQHQGGAKALLTRYLQGNASPKEQEQVEYWYSTLHAPASSALSPEERAILQQSILQHVIRQTLPAKPLYQRAWLRYAAMTALFVSLGGWLYTRYQPAPPLIVQTGVGTTRQLLLPDSSIVTLNAGSTLRVAAHFGQHERTVTLDGEAFFVIHPDPARPFRVKHGPLTTTVLGTAFNVRSYPGGENARVAVASGKVQVAAAGKNYILENNETLQYDNGSGLVIKGHEDTALIGQWQQAILDFNGYTLAGMATELQRQYPVRIQLYTTPADTAHYNIRFRRENIHNILDVLAGLTGITYKQENKQIIIYSKTYAH